MKSKSLFKVGTQLRLNLLLVVVKYDVEGPFELLSYNLERLLCLEVVSYVVPVDRVYYLERRCRSFLLGKYLAPTL